ncbi:TPA: hypothetical protein N0F65_010434 [Lagenidium giganteum]|uniref:Rab-GAP TBC domain-containing protein n=1 Tax=Lagenidium giganteum TaxID=4803 RepID=A0AAV2YSA2_9STRA|nr:TPA: hypothetical protein N0F65_010434 [Lagenidium giganteum]
MTTTPPATTPRGPSRVNVHGNRLACFRPQQRFRVVDTELQAAVDSKRRRDREHSDKQRVAACGCEQPSAFQCHVAPEEMQANELYQQRTRKWIDKFEAHNWASDKVSQKWKENQLKYVLEEESLLRAIPATEQAQQDAEHVEDLEVMELDDNRPRLRRGRSGSLVRMVSNFTSAAESMLLSRQFDGLLRAGVPPQLRGQVWWMCSGAAEKQQASSESYNDLLKRLSRSVSRRVAMEIEKDLPRTFPTERMHKTTSEASELRTQNVAELRRILQAYSVRNPAVGYCQSMNFLVAVLLHHLEEEEAFWVLAVMIEDLIPQFHTRTMSGSRAEQRVFTDLVQQKLPMIAQHMHALGVDLEPFTLKWFLCLFLNTLPFEPVLRIWDLFFCEGSHVLLRVGLTLLKLNQFRILACDDPIDVYEMFRFSHDTLRDITAPYRSGILNRDECVCDTLVRLAMDKSSFVGTIPFDSLHALRQCHRNDVEAEMAEADAQRRLSRAASLSQAQSEASGVQMTASEDDDDVDDDPRQSLDLLAEYDFVDDFSNGCCEVSPTKYIHFQALCDDALVGAENEASDYFIDVQFEGAVPQQCR